jgi:hypothetical protein
VLAGGLYERTSGAAGQPLAGYRRRTPERTVLHELVARHAQTMLAELRDADPDGGGLPRYVERELAAYLKCGVLAHGFCRVRCQTCGDEIVVAFSCKSRGICPSCTARRMADTATHLVTRVLPPAPYRQWVFTVPKLLRLRLARDPVWASWVGQLVVRAIGTWQRRVGRARGMRAARTGAIVFRQRFGGLVNLNVHYHVIVPDGVFVDDGDRLTFVMLPVPTSQDVLAILDRIVRRTYDTRRARAGPSRGSSELAFADRWSRGRARRRTAARVVRRQSFSIFARGRGDRRPRPRRARAAVSVRCAPGVRAGAPIVDRRWPHLVSAQAALARRSH